MKIGLISDTHGYFNPELRNIFNDVELILHAGDIGAEDIIKELEKLAPVRAVHGNTDYFPLTHLFPSDQHFSLINQQMWLTHSFDEKRSRDRVKLSKLRNYLVKQMML